jgi:hypothetical protein
LCAEVSTRIEMTERVAVDESHRIFGVVVLPSRACI